MTIAEERKVCTGSEKFFKMCESNEVGSIDPNKQPPLLSKNDNNTGSFGVFQLDLTFHLFVCALAGAGAAVIAMVMIIILKSAHSQHCYSFPCFPPA